MTSAWTSVDQVVAVLRKRWDRGQYLLAYAVGTPWVPISLPVKGPSSTELLDHLDEARRWVDRWERSSRTAGGVARFRIEYRTLRGRSIGANEVPARIWIDDLNQLGRLLATTSEVHALDAIMEQTSLEIPELCPWVISHPTEAIPYREIWGDILATVAWMAANAGRPLYLRQIDVEGVDTKFVERHQRLLGDLLTILRPAAELDPTPVRTDLARRLGFLPKPGYTRIRLLAPEPGLPAGITEVSLRTNELASLELACATVFVVENEITYLAFPSVPSSIVIFGSGFDLTRLDGLPWLRHKQIVYWGDIDTHGFDILNRLRSRFPDVRSILMDHDTLLAHPRQWAQEEAPTVRPLPHLTEAEAALYRDLIEDRYGDRVRLEQERVRFSNVRATLAPWARTEPS